MEDSVDLQKKTDNFLKTVKSLIEQFGCEMFLIQIKMVSSWEFILEDHCLIKK